MTSKNLDNLIKRVNYSKDELLENVNNNTLYNYILDYSDDIEFIFDVAHKFLGAIITVGSGAPNIYLDTRNGMIKGFWGIDNYNLPIDKEIKNELNNILYEFYQK